MMISVDFGMALRTELHGMVYECSDFFPSDINI